MPRGKSGNSGGQNLTLVARPLIPTAPKANEATSSNVPVEFVAPCPRNLRGDDLWDDLNERAEMIASMKALKLLSALVVVTLPSYLEQYPDHAAKFGPDVRYVIAAGHKRFDCVRSEELNWKEVRIDVQDHLAPYLDQVFLDENLHRKGLTAFQEAEGYARLREKMSDTEIAARYGLKSKSRVSKRVAILPLEKVPEARAAIVSGTLSPDMAHRLMTALNHDPNLVMPAFHLIRDDRLDVKEAARRVVLGSVKTAAPTLAVPAQATPLPAGDPSPQPEIAAPATPGPPGADESTSKEPVAEGSAPAPTTASSAASGRRQDITEMERERTRAAKAREEYCELLVKEYTEPLHADAQTLHTARSAVAMVSSEPLRLAHQWMISAGVTAAKGFKPESFRDSILAGDDQDLLLRFAYAATLADNETHSQDRRRVPDFRAIRHWRYLIDALGYEPGAYESQYL